jgi:magnesium-dependent phosphatase-1
VDSTGVEVRLYPDAPYVLSRLNEMGIVVSAASWNETRIGMMALEAFGIGRYFFEPQIEPHPNKHIMIRRLIDKLSSNGTKVSPGDILYVDDRDIHIHDIWRYVGPINFVRMWRDAKSHVDILCMVKSRIGPRP